MTETELSKKIGDYLTLRGLPNWRASVLNGKFKGFGQSGYSIIKTGIPGLSDKQALLTDGTGRTIYIEVKLPGKKQRKTQIEFESLCNKLNVPYFVAYSVSDVKQILDGFNI